MLIKFTYFVNIVMSTTFKKQLHRTRKIAGLSMDELVAKTGHMISKNAISRYERGVMLPSSRNLELLSNALGVTPDFLVQENNISITNIEFRKKYRLTLKDENRIKEKLCQLAEHYLDIETLLVIEDKHDLSFFYGLSHEYNSDIIAQSIRLQWNLGTSPIHSIYDLFEVHDIRMVEFDEINGFDGLSGFVNDRFPFIVINSNMTVERKRFTAAHELAHLLLYQNDIPRKEELCNAIARKFLLPPEEFIKRIGKNRNGIFIEELIVIQKIFGISIRAMLYCARESGVISNNHFLRLKRTFQENEELARCIDKERYVSKEYPMRFHNLVLKALSMELISKVKASELLQYNQNAPEEKFTYL